MASWVPTVILRPRNSRRSSFSRVQRVFFNRFSRYFFFFFYVFKFTLRDSVAVNNTVARYNENRLKISISNIFLYNVQRIKLQYFNRNNWIASQYKFNKKCFWLPFSLCIVNITISSLKTAITQNRCTHTCVSISFVAYSPQYY